MGKEMIMENTQMLHSSIFEIWEFITEGQKNLLLFSGFFQSYFEHDK